MSEPEIVIDLVNDRAAYQPGETLAAEFRLRAGGDNQPLAIEASVLWYAEGKGDEDLAVHYFERIEDDGDWHWPRRISTMLPNSPLSYDGVIVKIRWCVRIRAFLQRGKQVVADRSFRLGDVPPVSLPPEEEAPPAAAGKQGET